MWHNLTRLTRLHSAIIKQQDIHPSIHPSICPFFRDGFLHFSKTHKTWPQDHTGTNQPQPRQVFRGLTAKILERLVMAVYSETVFSGDASSLHLLQAPISRPIISPVQTAGPWSRVDDRNGITNALLHCLLLQFYMCDVSDKVFFFFFFHNIQQHITLLDFHHCITCWDWRGPWPLAHFHQCASVWFAPAVFHKVSIFVTFAQKRNDTRPFFQIMTASGSLVDGWAGNYLRTLLRPFKPLCTRVAKMLLLSEQYGKENQPIGACEGAVSRELTRDFRRFLTAFPFVPLKKHKEWPRTTDKVVWTSHTC